MEKLTNKEEEIMHILWRLEKAFVKDVLAEIKNDKPHYNTLSTIIRNLEEKGYLAYNAYGKTHQYYPIILKEEYKGLKTDNLLSNFFGGSKEAMLSFFVNEQKMDINALDEILKELKKK